jgi:hypothetical protein
LNKSQRHISVKIVSQFTRHLDLFFMDASCLDHAFDSNTPKLDIHENLIRTILKYNFVKK